MLRLSFFFLFFFVKANIENCTPLVVEHVVINIIHQIECSSVPINIVLISYHISTELTPVISASLIMIRDYFGRVPGALAFQVGYHPRKRTFKILPGMKKYPKCAFLHAFFLLSAIILQKIVIITKTHLSPLNFVRFCTPKWPPK